MAMADAEAKEPLAEKVRRLSYPSLLVLVVSVWQLIKQSSFQVSLIPTRG